MQYPYYKDLLSTRKAGTLGVSSLATECQSQSTIQQEAWKLANLFAGRPRVRVARWDGRRKKWQYPAQREQDLTKKIPTAPAAVMLYDEHGMCQTLVADIDVEGKSGLALTHQVVAFLQHHGTRVIIDRSPAGKHHVYIPLLNRLSVHEASELISALAHRFPGIDPLPHTTGAASGCIRPPGSPYKDGTGYQELITDLDTARRTLMQRNGADVIARLRQGLTDEIAYYRRERMHIAQPVEKLQAAHPVERLPLGEIVLSSKIQMIVREGLYAEAGYSDRSRARMAALAAARRAGMNLEDVITRMEDGRWPGLRAMYQNATTPWRRLLTAIEWPKVIRLVGTSRKKRTQDSRGTRLSTSATQARNIKSRGGGWNTSDEHRFLRRIRYALYEASSHEFKTRQGRTHAYVLRALLAAAHQRRSRYVEFGVRSLSLSLPLDYTGVSRALKELREQEDPWITLERDGKGTKADLYCLHLPQRYKETAEKAPLLPGKVHALRPAFRILGIAAADIFEAVERGYSNPNAIARITGLSRNTVYEHIGILKGWHLLVETSEGLAADTKRLDVVAELLGVTVMIARKIEIIRQQRHLWLRYLSRFTREDETWWEMTLKREAHIIYNVA